HVLLRLNETTTNGIDSTFARNVKGVDHEELEKTIVASFPIHLVLPTSRFIFDDLTRLRAGAPEKTPGNALIERQLIDLKRVLEHVAERMVNEDVGGAEKFLEQLFFNKILAFSELPPEVQYPGQHRSGSTARCANISPTTCSPCPRSTDPERCHGRGARLQRALPGLLEETLVGHADGDGPRSRASRGEKPGLGGGQLPDGPLAFVFQEHSAGLAAAIDRTQEEDLDKAADLISRLGPIGAEVLLEALTDSKDRR
ncbi:MAG: hypothetical protein MZU91_07005, partial [Desulfosudis oleivorans]|nr:hypothetical protein [Desulfosudis oleivorans]